MNGDKDIDEDKYVEKDGDDHMRHSDLGVDEIIHLNDMIEPVVRFLPTFVKKINAGLLYRKSILALFYN